MLRSRSVILVGNDLPVNLPNLLSGLEAGGFDLIETQSAEEVRPLLDEDLDATIVVYDPGGGVAHGVLQMVGEQGKNIPVIVVVNNGSFEEYYELMCEGAYDYFELSHSPEEIERSVRWAAGSRVAEGRRQAAISS